MQPIIAIASAVEDKSAPVEQRGTTEVCPTPPPPKLTSRRHHVNHLKRNTHQYDGVVKLLDTSSVETGRCNMDDTSLFSSFRFFLFGKTSSRIGAVTSEGPEGKPLRPEWYTPKLGTSEETALRMDLLRYTGRTGRMIYLV